MGKAKPLVIVTRKLPEQVESRMRELFDARFSETDAPMTQAELAEALRTADVLVPTITDRIDAHLIAQAGERLKLIAARLNEAVARGCDLATAATLPGSGSQRNYERCGFEVVYTKVTLADRDMV